MAFLLSSIAAVIFLITYIVIAIINKVSYDKQPGDKHFMPLARRQKLRKRIAIIGTSISAILAAAAFIIALTTNAPLIGASADPTTAAYSTRMADTICILICSAGMLVVMGLSLTFLNRRARLIILIAGACAALAATILAIIATSARITELTQAQSQAQQQVAQAIERAVLSI